MKKKIILTMCAVMSASFLMSGCGKQESNDVVLGEIQDVDKDEDGSIVLGGVGIIEDDDNTSNDEFLHSNTESTESKKEDSKKEDSKQEDSKKEESKKEDSKKEDSKKEESKQEETVEEVSKYDTFDSVELDKAGPAELYNWFNINILTKLSIVDEVKIAEDEKLAPFVYYVSEQDEQMIKDYYDYINNRIAEDENLATFYFNGIDTQEVKDSFYIQVPEEFIFYPTNISE